jgi:glycosyltransferase involved in cell wall biosynthesis
VLVDPVGRSQAVAELTKAVLGLTPSRRRKLGAAAQRRIADQYTWPAKARQIIRVYQSVCAPPETFTSGETSWRR